MKSKKFVLAALALLAAITMVLLPLAGCKNDSVPEPTRYTVKFETDHGTDPDDITVVSGTKLTDKDLAIEPEVGDNIFEYWYDKDDDARKPVEEGYTVTKDVTLVAKWRDRGTVASVTFTPADGTKFYCDESIAVSLTSEEGATIQYHLGDGSWKDYDAGGKIQVTVDTTITAKATKDGLKDSAETKATYSVRKLEGITVTPSEGTVYRVGEEVVHKKDGEIGVTATYDDGTTRTVTGTITTDTNTLTQSTGIGKTVTVSYKEGDATKEATFTVDVASYQFTETVQNVDSSYAGTMADGTYKKFGDWPQTIKDKDVAVGKNTMTRGGMDFHVGGDGNYYVKITAKPYKDTYTYTYTYSDGNLVEKDKEVYFKVEPIVWRVLTEDYKDSDGNSTGNALLLAESILIGGIPYYVDTNTRTITGAGTIEVVPDTVYSNNWQYSTIRAWLNGSYEADDTQDKTYEGIGFLQTAFTEFAQKLIELTSVNNSAASTFGTGESTRENPYACGKTKDKVFLLSEEEATTSEYDFDEYNKYVGDDYDTTTSTRIRVTTDYAKATGAYQGNPSAGYGGLWWLRSPIYNNGNNAHDIYDNGNANERIGSVRNIFVGVVPALSISLQ